MVIRIERDWVPKVKVWAGFKGQAELIVGADQTKWRENFQSPSIERFPLDANRGSGQPRKYPSFLLWPSAKVHKVDRYS